MGDRSDDPEAGCPRGEADGGCTAFTAAMDVLGRPWNGKLLRALSAGSLRFSALAERLAIGDRMLSCRLKELEAAGLLERAVDPGPPVRVSYALTPLGQGLGEVTRAIEAWGAQLVAARSRAAAMSATCAGDSAECVVEGAEDRPIPLDHQVDGTPRG